MRGRILAAMGLAALALFALTLFVAACDSSDDEERLAAQRLFRNFLIQSDATAAADVRIQKLVDELPPDFPVADDLQLLGSAFSDTETERELIVGWQSEDQDADALYEFYSQQLGREPWSISADPRVVGIDFISFRDEDNDSFRGELRIAQEGDTAVVVLIARNDLSGGAVPSGGGT